MTWFDYAAVDAMAEGLPAVSFVLIGPHSRDGARAPLGPFANPTLGRGARTARSPGGTCTTPTWA